MKCKWTWFYGFRNMLHDDQKETVWQRTEEQNSIWILKWFIGLRIMKDQYVNWVNSVDFIYTLYIGLFITGMAAVSVSSDIQGFSNIWTLPFNSGSFLAVYLKINFNSQLLKKREKQCPVNWVVYMIFSSYNALL
jgi:hypothetical protein